MDASNSIAQVMSLLISSGNPSSDALAGFVVVAGLLAIAIVYGPLVVRLMRVRSLAVAVERAQASRSRTGKVDPAQIGRDLDRCFAASPLNEIWSELLERRRNVEAHSPEDRAPIRLADLFAEQPLVAAGVRKSLLGALPVLLFVLGLGAAVADLVSGMIGSGAATATPGHVLGLALRGLFWGLCVGSFASFLSVTLMGAADALGARLDKLVARTHRSLTSGEVAMRGAHAQELGFTRVSSLLVQVSEDLRDTIDRGLARIEQSTASAAGLVSEEQRRVLEVVMSDLTGLMQRGVEEHVHALRASLDLATRSQTELSRSLADTIGQVNEGAESNARVSSTLASAADAVDTAAGAISSGASEFKPLVEHLGDVAGALERTAGRIEQASAQAAQATQQGGNAALPAYRNMSDELTRMSESFVGLVEPLRGALERFDDSAGVIAGSVDDFMARATALEERLGAQETRSELVPAPAAEPEVAAPAEEHPGGDLSMALERSHERQASRGEPAPAAREDFAAAAAADADGDEAGRSGASALLGRYRAPRFSIEELPESLRNFTAEDAWERAHREDREAADLEAPPTGLDETETDELGTATRYGEDERETASQRCEPNAAQPAAPAEDERGRWAAEAAAGPPACAAPEAGPPTPRPTATGNVEPEDNEERRRKRLERFFGQG